LPALTVKTVISVMHGRVMPSISPSHLSETVTRKAKKRREKQMKNISKRKATGRA